MLPYSKGTCSILVAGSWLARNRLCPVSQHGYMPEIVNWQQDDPRVVVARVLELLAAGQLVAFPSAGGYDVAASALAPAAVACLPAGEGFDQALTVALGSPAEVLDWAPGLSRLGQRLARRSWPGPLTLVSDEGVSSGLVSWLPEPVRRRVWVDGAVSLRMPEHQALRLVLCLLGGPLLLSNVGKSANGSGTAEVRAGPFGQEIALVLEDGPSCPGQPVSVVRVQGQQWQMVREGALSAAAVAAMTPCRILFVCTGNTCRSPLAQVLCTKMLADQFGCSPQDLPGLGYVVQSAGLVATRGGEAAAEAVDIARELGADLSGHRSQPLTLDLLAQVDHLFAMTTSHLRALLGQGLDLGPAPRLLSPQGQDVPDPIGGSLEVYRECAQQILQYLQEWLPQLHGKGGRMKDEG